MADTLSADGERAGLEANLDRYRLLVLATSSLFWVPTTFLFFLDRFGLTTALQLQAIYYLSVVAAEVPSGWFSDRIGRVTTLRFVAVWWVGAFSAFLFADTMTVAAIGQAFLALGFAFQSGTDVTFHYDTLEALGRAGSFEVVESAARRNGMVMRAAAVISGGAMGMIDLRLPFAAGLAATVALGLIALGLREPPRSSDRGRFLTDVTAVVRLFGSRLLGWLLIAIVAQVILEHLASEFAGPYFAEVLGEDLTNVDRAPLLTGILAAVVALVGAASVGRAPWLRDRFGLIGALTLLAIIPAVTVTTMALVTSVAVFALLALRNVQVAIGGVLISGAASRRVAQHQRATFLSLTSLGGRLAYGGVLLALSTTVDFAATLQWAAVIAVAVALAIWLTGIGVADD